MSTAVTDRRRTAHQRGFTLIELLTVVALVALAATIAIPSFRLLAERNRVTVLANDLVHDLTLARSEAVKRNSRVTVCRSSELAGCARAGGWEQGWIVFVDGDADADVGAGEAILAARAAAGGTAVIEANAPVADHVTYGPLGRAVNGTFQIRSGSQQRRVILFNARARITDPDV